MARRVERRALRLAHGIALSVMLAASACSRGPASSDRRASATASTTAVGPVDWARVDQALGRPGEPMAGDVHRYGFPRSDLKVSLDGVALKPGFALGSYAAFVPTHDSALVMGDLVLTEAEVSPVMAKLQEQGFDVTGLHNHLLREQPKVMYLHYMGHGPDAAALARGLRSGLEASSTPLGAPPAAPPARDLGFDPAELDRVLGHAGKTTGGIQKYAIARNEAVRVQGGAMDGLALSPPLGVATVINFQPLGGNRAAITGDFALVGTEVAPVTRTLRSHGIEVTAAHSHMTDDEPHLYYVHFFATGPAADLATGLRAALDKTNSAKG